MILFRLIFHVLQRPLSILFRDNWFYGITVKKLAKLSQCDDFKLLVWDVCCEVSPLICHLLTFRSSKPHLMDQLPAVRCSSVEGLTASNWKVVGSNPAGRLKLFGGICVTILNAHIFQNEKKKTVTNHHTSLSLPNYLQVFFQSILSWV